MANLVPRAFPLKVGKGKSPGNEVEIWLPYSQVEKREKNVYSSIDC